MAIGLLGRLETFAELRESEVTSINDRNRAQHTAVDAMSAQEHAEAAERRSKWLEGELDNLVYNMSQRAKARGIKKRDEKYLWLHKLGFEQTYRDVHNAEQKDIRVREYFDPLLAACDGDKRLLLAGYKKALDRYFPIGEADIYWLPALRLRPFTPKRKSDTRTVTFTIVHFWGHTKKIL